MKRGTGPDLQKLFWPHLLVQRSQARWGNFFWFSPKTLLLSLNDQVAKLIEKPNSNQTIVDRRRIRWVNAQTARGHSPYAPVRVPSSGVLLLGDTGEMDGSQYSLVRDLSALTKHLRERGDRPMDTALLMSDVVYPAGDINQWADAVYLPYLGLPRAAWKTAVAAWTAHREPPTTTDHHADGQDQEGPTPEQTTAVSVEATSRTLSSGPTANDEQLIVEPPLRDFNVLAMPGNHDWYDGLNGFMYHACGSDPLPDIPYDREGMAWRERAAAFWWRRSARPKLELIQELRDAGAARAIERGSPRNAGIPHLPGPYYAVDVGCSASDPSSECDHSTCGDVVRILVVDTGITHTIDVQQARWVRTMLQTRTPTVVITGVPIAVNNRINRFRIAGKLQPDTDDSEAVEDLLGLVAGKEHVIASVGGDTHNYQRMIFDGTARSLGLPPLQIVAGGSGAYLSSAHTVAELGGGEVALKQDPKAGSVVIAKQVLRFPTRAQSVLHFEARVGGPGGVARALLGAVLIGLSAVGWTCYRLDDPAAVAVSFGDTGVTISLATTAPFVMLVWGGLAVLISKRSVRRAPVPKMLGASLVACLTVALIAASWCLLVQVAGGTAAIVVAIGVGFVVVLLTAQFIGPLLDGVPQFRWLQVTVGILLTGVVVVGVAQSRWPPLTALGVIVLSLGVFLVRRALQRGARDWNSRSVINAKARWLSALAKLAPPLFVALVISVTTIVFPRRILELYGVPESTSEGIAQLVTMLALMTLGFGCALPVFAAFLFASWKTASCGVLAAPSLGGVIAAVGATVLSAEKGALDRWMIPIFVLAALLGAGLGLTAVLMLHAEPASEKDIDDALAYQDARRAAKSSAASPHPTPAPSPSKGRAIFRTMFAAGVPQIDTLAESKRGPFLKSVLVMEIKRAGAMSVEFTCYGLNQESSRAEIEIAADLERTDQTVSGFFLVDRVSVTQDGDGRWSAEQTATSPG